MALKEVVKRKDNKGTRPLLENKGGYAYTHMKVPTKRCLRYRQQTAKYIESIPNEGRSENRTTYECINRQTLAKKCRENMATRPSPNEDSPKTDVSIEMPRKQCTMTFAQRTQRQQRNIVKILQSNLRL